MSPTSVSEYPKGYSETLLAGVVGMCTIGSFAAWQAGNVVLGGFTLFLTFCIGIRFLVKHTTERKNGVVKGEKLDLKGVAVSRFFGLTIGFGAGFVGIGGVTSLIAARFANQVSNRIVGRVTGVILTAMGVILISIAAKIIQRQKKKPDIFSIQH